MTRSWERCHDICEWTLHPDGGRRYMRPIPSSLSYSFLRLENGGPSSWAWPGGAIHSTSVEPQAFIPGKSTPGHSCLGGTGKVRLNSILEERREFSDRWVWKGHFREREQTAQKPGSSGMHTAFWEGQVVCWGCNKGTRGMGGACVDRSCSVLYVNTRTQTRTALFSLWEVSEGFFM